MADFNASMKILSELEKGLDKSQPANPSNFGITLNFLKAINDDVNRDGRINMQDLLALTPDKAAALFHSHFWNLLNLDAVRSQAIADHTLALAVNVGPGHAVALVQKSLVDLNQPIVVDGKLGEHTMDALNSVNPSDFLTHLRSHAEEYYRALAAHIPGMLKQLAGWLSRVAA